MKPERIQIIAPIEQRSSGVFQILRFETAQKVKAFADFVTHMAENYGRGVTCQSDLDRNELTVLSPDDAVSVPGSAEQPSGVRKFLGKVVEAFHLWSSPGEES